jgi:hypothetical protein
MPQNARLPQPAILILITEKLFVRTKCCGGPPSLYVLGWSIEYYASLRDTLLSMGIITRFNNFICNHLLFGNGFTGYIVSERFG